MSQFGISLNDHVSVDLVHLLRATNVLAQDSDCNEIVLAHALGACICTRSTIGRLVHQYTTPSKSRISTFLRRFGHGTPPVLCGKLPVENRIRAAGTDLKQITNDKLLAAQLGLLVCRWEDTEILREFNVPEQLTLEQILILTSVMDQPAAC